MPNRKNVIKAPFSSVRNSKEILTHYWKNTWSHCNKRYRKNSWLSNEIAQMLVNEWHYNSSRIWRIWNLTILWFLSTINEFTDQVTLCNNMFTDANPESSKEINNFLSVKIFYLIWWKKKNWLPLGLCS